MSPAQSDLLRRLIAADRSYRTAVARGESADLDHRGIEVIGLNGVCRRTALSLVEQLVAAQAEGFSADAC